MKLNLNSFVTVTLTQRGFLKLHEWHRITYNAMPNNESKMAFQESAEQMVIEPGKIRCQMTKLNEIFGNWAYPGMECFSMDVEVEEYLL